MDDPNLSSGGADAESDHQSDAQSADKPSNNGGNNLPPPNGNNITEFGFFHFIRNLIFAGVVATGIWLVGAQCHDNGYVKLGNAFNFIACIVFFAVLPFEAIKHWPRPTIVWPLFAIFSFGVAFVFFGLKSESKPYPHFKFFLCLGDAHDDAVELTNDFLFINITTNLEKTESLGILCLPAQAEPPNAVLSILINNDSHVDADDVVVSVGFSKNLACAPDAGWEVVESKSSYGFNGPSSEKITRKLQEWAFGGARNNFGLLSGNGIWLPNIQIKQENLNEGWGSFDIMARAKGSPAELLSMKVIFCRNPPNLPPIHKPFLILAWTNSNDQEILKITPKQSIEMQR
jgi:hypothetical protein